MFNDYLMEGLRASDLKHLISPYISIDQYTSKLSDDNITLAFFCNEREVAQDLHDFIEKMYVIEIKDIEISSTITEDNKYIVFVELERNPQFPKILMDMIESINFLIDAKVEDWYFVTFGMKIKKKLTNENILSNVRLTKLEEPIKEDKMKQKLKQETVTYSNQLFTKMFLDEGYVSEREMIKIIENSETFNEDSIELEVLEYNNPGAEIITADEHCFIIGDKIRKLRMM